MKKLSLLLLCAGCVVQVEENDPLRSPAGTAPQIVFAEAEAREAWDGAFWQLEAEVERGSSEIVSVQMEFYDEAHERCFIERIDLFPGFWEDTWELDWKGPHDLLNPWHDQYSVVVLATDAAGRTDLVEIWPDAL